jgi:hypothetical protein
MRVASCAVGGSLSLDTTVLADGHHDLRVVAIAATAIETQGRLVVPVSFANGTKTLALKVVPPRIPSTGKVTVSIDGSGIGGTLVFATGRVLGRITGETGTLEVRAAMLGKGPVTIHATGRGGLSAAESVNATPVTVTVMD